MKKIVVPAMLAAVVVIVTLAFTMRLVADPGSPADLTGAWRSKVQMHSGPYVSLKDFAFMYSYNAGGTMTESSNYDAAPPCMPAYGIWKKTVDRQFETKYLFWITKAAGIEKQIADGGGWSPDGYGILREKITLSADGNAYNSTLTFETFDQEGKSTSKIDTGTCVGTRITF
jgi:hypothetical protein